jgi:hypothetical protein
MKNNLLFNKKNENQPYLNLEIALQKNILSSLKI